MCAKCIYSICAKLIILSLIVTVNLSSLTSHLYPEEGPTQVLRPASHQNGGGKLAGKLTSAIDPSPFQARPANPGGHQTKVSVFEGAVEFDTSLVPAGKSATSLSPGRLQTLSRKELEAVSEEFAGTYLGFAKWQLWAAHVSALEQNKGLQSFKRNKVVEFNTDILPDFGPEFDPRQTEVAKGILEVVAYEMLQYKKDKRFWSHQGKIYIDFASRDGSVEGEAKRNAVVELFKNLSRDIKKYHPEEMLFSEKVGPHDRVTITHQNDSAEIKNPVLMLEAMTVVGGKVKVYPWDSIMDLSVGILSIDRTRPLSEQAQTHNAIKNLFKDLIEVLDIEPKDKLQQRLDDILPKLLSNNPQEYIDAARELILPPVEEVDLDAIDDINRIMLEVARWA